MCRWIAYTGKPIFMDGLITRPAHSLVRQSLNAQMHFHKDGSLWATNGDGFGVGWYAQRDEPGLFKGSEPAWNNENLHEICSQIQAHTFMAHVRANTSGGTQRSNSHPFKHKNWLFQHNGHIRGFEKIRRDLVMALTPEYFDALKGGTDSETFFMLALMFGLEQEPRKAMQKLVDFLAQTCEKAGMEMRLNLSIAMSDGRSLYTIRYATNEEANTQFYSTDSNCMKDVSEHCDEMPSDGIVVVSEPLDQLGTKWNEVPKNSFLSICDGQVSRVPLMD